jgi:hypothetical protein
VRHLEDVKSPMIQIDIINILIHNLPESYSPLIVIVDTLLDDPLCSVDSTTVQDVIKHLLNEEICLANAGPDGEQWAAKLARSSNTCYNCGEPSHIRFDCDLSPCKAHWCRENKRR